MNLNKLIVDTLRPLGYPVSKGRYNQKADTYIVFIEYNQNARLTADDEEIVTRHFYQVDVFSKGNFDDLVNDVRNKMIEAGFMRMFESRTYDEDMNMHRAIMRFNYETIIRSDS